MDNRTDALSGRRTVAGRSIRWDAARAVTAYAKGHWISETLADALTHAAHAEPERVLVRDGAVALTAAHLHDRARALAFGLLDRMPLGSVVSFMLPNWHEAAEIYLGITLAGMVAHPVLPSLREHDLRFMLGDVASRMVFIPETFRGFDYAALLDRVTLDQADAPEVVVLRGAARAHTPYARLFESPPVMLPPLDPNAVRIILYTSGTTGSPKGVMHTHNSLHALLRQIGEHWLIAPGDRFLVPSPISHIGGSIYAFEAPLLLGTSVVLMDRWDPDEGVAVAVEQRCTHLAGATPFLEALLAAARRAGTRLPDLKVFICGGASVPPALVREAAAYFDRTIVTRAYGSTEVPVTTVGVTDRAELALAADTDGRPAMAEVVLAEDGEIRTRGPQMLVGYVHAEDEAGVFDKAGFYRTGDLGRWAGQGCLVVTGRSKDIIIRHGENISPKEIEDLLVLHPAVREVAVVGIPDPQTGERAVAVIVGDEGFDLAAMHLHLGAQGLAKFKFPETLALWRSLPRNDAGKVLKHRIRERLLEDQKLFIAPPPSSLRA